MLSTCNMREIWTDLKCQYSCKRRRQSWLVMELELENMNEVGLLNLLIELGYLGCCHVGKDVSQEGSFDWFGLGCRFGFGFGFWHSCEHARTVWDRSDARRTGGRRDDEDGLHRTLCIWHRGMIGFLHRSSGWMAPRNTSPMRSI